jgi:hypothetical protein
MQHTANQSLEGAPLGASATVSLVSVRALGLVGLQGLIIIGLALVLIIPGCGQPI